MAASPILLAMSNVSRSEPQAFFQPRRPHKPTQDPPNVVDMQSGHPERSTSPLDGIRENFQGGSSQQNGQLRPEQGSTVVMEDEDESGARRTSEVAKSGPILAPLNGNATGPGLKAWPISSKNASEGRKRRKLTHASIGKDTASGGGGTEESNRLVQTEVVSVGSSSLPIGDAPNASQPQSAVMSPKRVLKLNAAGGLGPPSSMPRKEDGNTKSKRRGRPPKPKATRIVKIRYPSASLRSFASQVDQILSGELRHELKASASLGATQGVDVQSRSTKATHPFFSGKVHRHNGANSTQQHPNDRAANSPRRPTAATPGKIRRQIAEMKAREANLEHGRPEVALQAQNRGTVWPPRGMLHVRGHLDEIARRSPQHVLHKRKKKCATALPTPVQDVFLAYGPSHLAQMFSARRTRPDGFYDPDPTLHLPSRQLLTGNEILALTIPILSKANDIHPALETLVASISSHMTAFDVGRGETQSWTYKYAPSSAQTVLQVGGEAAYLRDWLKASIVDHVDKGGSSKPRMPEAKPRRKRRKVTDELDDFIVASDDESDRLEALSDLDEPEMSGTTGKSVARSIAQVVSGDRAANTIVLSGPPGCGKTATVYAVAKELNFQVFEINSGGRRSGRDILERIGDVLGNHIVSRDRVDAGSLSADEDAARVDAALQEDLVSGRQGTMNAFFKPQVIAKVQKLAKKDLKPDNNKRPSASQGTDVSKRQKQSLILLEEVDVLFEEDRSFWTTVCSLIATSRRPIIMTCTNESAVPLEDRELQAILRLSPPPEELAVDYLVLLSAQEGHLLDRSAIATMYRHKQDLRAAIMELQFWCQMGIGDPRGGLSWIFQRWPPGVGLDQHGKEKRVTSKDTYHDRVSLLHSHVVDSSGHWEEELMSVAWTDWQVDPRDEAHLCLGRTTNLEGIAALKHMQTTADALSALDIYSTIALPETGLSPSSSSPLGSVVRSVHLDPTQPDISHKSRLSYTEMPALLQDESVVDYTNLDRNIAVSVCKLVQRDATNQRNLESQLRNRIASPKPAQLHQTVPSASVYAALEPLIDPPASSSQQLTSGNYTSLISPLSSITRDIAPYVRAIAAYDQALQQERKKLHEVVHGAGEGKMRKTRAARGALEGKGRGGVRREQWWDCELDLAALRATGPAGTRMCNSGLEENRDES